MIFSVHLASGMQEQRSQWSTISRRGEQQLAPSLSTYMSHYQVEI